MPPPAGRGGVGRDRPERQDTRWLDDNHIVRLVYVRRQLLNGLAPINKIKKLTKSVAGALVTPEQIVFESPVAVCVFAVLQHVSCFCNDQCALRV